jgi:serine/threonine protein kinase
MDLAAAASAIDLSHFEINFEPIGTVGSSQMFFGRDRRTNFPVTIHTTTLSHPRGGRTEKRLLVIFLQSYFQKVANLIYSVHPIFSSFLGWNVQLGVDDSRFSIVTEYILPNPLRSHPEGGFELSPTSRQILLYGLADDLYSLHQSHLVHQVVQPSNLWLDDNQYPILLNVGLATWVVDLETGKVTGGCPWYMLPRFY